MPEFTATVRVLVEGTVEIEAPDADAACEVAENMDFIEALNTMSVETDEVELLGDIEETTETE